ncbi:hypothetical protein Afil01_29060 [Actinorhabdospora filicis]|uniref:DUF3592 domain-containing protein n=1 Tax=Actinorhabdospora filicis TaxID=1785913 RepID=A0A9W6SLS7_9ACTN|nr:hypothetical protein [Actinorhabdospora filicis]GLZ78099.1 hypothetical protein Afil01_29060 [Actinorhabdospora filicis]
MPNPPAQPEISLAGSRLAASFDGRRLLLRAGRTTWTVPVNAIAEAIQSEGTYVLLRLTGPAHGLDAEFSLTAPNKNSAETFVRSVERARRKAGTDPEAHARIERVDAPGWTATPAGRKVTRWVLPAGCLLAVLVLLLIVSPLPGWIAAMSLFFAMAAAGGGGFLTWRVLRRVRSLWILKQRGIGVVGRKTRDHYVGSRGSMWIFPVMEFRTAEGKTYREVISVATSFSFSPAEMSGKPITLDLIYDPQDPRRATRTYGIGFLLRTALLAVPALGLSATALSTVLVNLPI